MTSPEELLTDLSSALFASLRRRDQREMARTYVRGLLTTPGRKSFRNMAVHLGGSGLEQSLHHFVSCSTWDHAPVARAVADTMVPVAPPQGWVLRTLMTPREGERTVGVHKRFFVGRGQVMNAQYAVGLWAGSTRMCYPVAWRLLLPPEWIQDEVRRVRAAIPDDRTAETPADCAARAYLGLPAALRGRLPVVVDMCGLDMDVVTVVHRLRAARVPFLVRAYRALPLTVVDPARPARDRGALSSYQILADAEHGGGHRASDGSAVPGPHGAAGSGPGPASGAERTSRTLVATVRVRSPHHPPDLAQGRGDRRDPYDLLLLGTRADARHPTDEMWLTNMLDADPGTLLELTALPRRVDDTCARITERVGIRDFTGRSYDGWNRHSTLASTAHAIALLAGAETSGADACGAGPSGTSASRAHTSGADASRPGTNPPPRPGA